MFHRHLYSSLCLILCNFFQSSSLETSVNLAAQITKNYFGHCTIVQTTNVDYLNDSDEYFESLHPVTNSNSFFVWNFVAVANKNISVSREFHNRYGPDCVAVIALFRDKSSLSLDKFLEVFTPRIHPLTRRNEDNYIFLSRSSAVCEQVLHSEIIRKELKFKLVIYPDLKLFTNCFYCKNETAKVEVVGDKENRRLRNLFPDFTLNFQGYSLKVTAPSKYEPVYQMHYVNETYRNKRGIHTSIFQILQNKLNFTYDLNPCSNGITGRLAPNGTWLGCVGDLVYGRSEFSLSVGPDMNRNLYLSTTAPIHYRYITFVIHKPKAKYKWDTVFRTFDKKSWAIIGVSIILTGIILYVTDNLLASERVNFPIISTAILRLFGYLVCQSFNIYPDQKAPSRIVLSIWLFCGLVLSFYYSCSLQSLIVIPGYEFSPRNIVELVTSGFSWGCSRQFQSGLGWELLKSSEHPVMRLLYEKIETDETDMDCLTRSTSSNYACFNWDNHYEFYAGTQLQEKDGHVPLQKAKENTLFMVMVSSARKREVFLNVFDEFLNRQFVMGIWMNLLEEDRRLYRINMMKKDENVFTNSRKKRTEDKITFSLAEAKACFIVFASGIAFSLVRFTQEVLPNLL